MKIKSKFVDYYDYVPHQYAEGGDPKIVYNRTRIKELDTSCGALTDFPFELSIPSGLNIRRLPANRKHNGFDYQYAWLIVAGRYFPMVRSGPFISSQHEYHHFNDDLESFLVIDEERDPDTWTRMMTFGRPKYTNRYDEEETGDITDRSQPNKHLIELSKLVGHPVFVITDHVLRYTTMRRVTISRKCPHLAKLGMANIYMANEIYQDLSYFVGNIMNESPDMMPAPKPPMTDKERVVSHGFDLKQSFRHRK